MSRMRPSEPYQELARNARRVRGMRIRLSRRKRILSWLDLSELWFCLVCFARIGDSLSGVGLPLTLVCRGCRYRGRCVVFHLVLAIRAQSLVGSGVLFRSRRSQASGKCSRRRQMQRFSGRCSTPRTTEYCRPSGLRLSLLPRAFCNRSVASQNLGRVPRLRSGHILDGGANVFENDANRTAEYKAGRRYKAGAGFKAFGGIQE